MKKFIIALMLISVIGITSFFLFSSDNDEHHYVNFYIDEVLLEQKRVNDNVVLLPEVLEKPNMRHSGWFIDVDLTTPFDNKNVENVTRVHSTFETINDIDPDARWQIDYSIQIGDFNAEGTLDNILKTQVNISFGNLLAQILEKNDESIYNLDLYGFTLYWMIDEEDILVTDVINLASIHEKLISITGIHVANTHDIYIITSEGNLDIQIDSRYLLEIDFNTDITQIILDIIEGTSIINLNENLEHNGWFIYGLENDIFIDITQTQEILLDTIYMPNGNVRLEASIREVGEYVVTFDLGEGAIFESTQSQTHFINVREGEYLYQIINNLMTYLQPTRLGWTNNIVWQKDSNEEYINLTTTMPSNNITINALWQEYAYVTISINEGSDVEVVIDEISDIRQGYQLSRLISRISDLENGYLLYDEYFFRLEVVLATSGAVSNGLIMSDLVLDVNAIRTHGLISFETQFGTTPEQIRVALGTSIIDSLESIHILADITSHTFGGWLLGDRQLLETDLMTGASITLQAQWNIRMHTITFETGAGSNVESIQDIEHYTNVVSLILSRATYLEGNSFVWMFDDEEITIEREIFITENITVIAYWSIEEFEASITIEIGGSTQEIIIDIPFDAPIIDHLDDIDVGSKIGYRHDGWYIRINDEYVRLNAEHKMPAGSINIIPRWIEHYIIITIELVGNYGSINTGNVNDTFQVQEGTNLDIVLGQVRGYISFDITTHDFGNLTYEDASVNNELVMLNMLVSVEVIRTHAYITITCERNIVSHPSIRVALDSNILYVLEGIDVIDTLNRFNFYGWFRLDTGLFITEDSQMPALDITLQARFTTNEFVINFDTAGGSLVESIMAPYGSTIMYRVSSIGIPQRTGYVFDRWLLDGLYLTNQTMPTNPITLVATWMEQGVYITVELDDIEEIAYPMTSLSFNVQEGTHYLEVFDRIRSYITIPNTHRLYLVIGQEEYVNDNGYILGDITIVATITRIYGVISFSTTHGEVPNNVLVLINTSIIDALDLETDGIHNFPDVTNLTFNGWMINGVYLNETHLMDQNNIVLTASWSVTITLNLLDEENVSDIVVSIFSVSIGENIEDILYRIREYNYVIFPNNTHDIRNLLDANYNIITGEVLQNTLIQVEIIRTHGTAEFTSSINGAYVPNDLLIPIGQPILDSLTSEHNLSNVIGSEFIGWSLDGINLLSVNDIMDQPNIELIAIWAVVYVTVEITLSHYGEIRTYSFEVVQGTPEQEILSRIENGNYVSYDNRTHEFGSVINLTQANVNESGLIIGDITLEVYIRRIAAFLTIENVKGTVTETEILTPVGIPMYTVLNSHGLTTLPNVIGYYFVNWLSGQNILDKESMFANDLTITANWNEWYIDVTIYSNIEDTVIYVDTITVRQGTPNEQVISLVIAEDFVTYNPDTHELYEAVITLASTVNYLVVAITVQVIIIRTHGTAEFISSINPEDVPNDLLIPMGQPILNSLTPAHNLANVIGSQFMGWSLDGTYVLTIDDIMNLSYIELIAIWINVNVTVEITLDYYGTIVIPTFVVPQGTPEQEILSRIENGNYVSYDALTHVFDSITNLTSANINEAGLITGDIELEVYIRRIAAFLTIEEVRGTVEYTRILTPVGMLMSEVLNSHGITTLPNVIGYYFVNWLLDGNTLNNNLVFANDLTITASWNDWYIEVTIDSNIENIVTNNVAATTVRQGTTENVVLTHIRNGNYIAYNSSTHRFDDVIITFRNIEDDLVIAITVQVIIIRTHGTAIFTSDINAEQVPNDLLISMGQPILNYITSEHNLSNVMGSEFIGWSLDGTNILAASDIMLSPNIELRAIWDYVDVVVEITLDYYGTIVTPTFVVPQGTSLEILLSRIKNGNYVSYNDITHVFDSVINLTSASVENGLIIADVELRVYIRRIAAFLTIENDRGTVEYTNLLTPVNMSMSEVLDYHGITALPNVIGYYFVNWLLAGNILNKDLMFVNDLTITATWNLWFIDARVYSNIDAVVSYVDTIEVRQGTSLVDLIFRLRGGTYIDFNNDTHQFGDVINLTVPSVENGLIINNINVVAQITRIAAFITIEDVRGTVENTRILTPVGMSMSEVLEYHEITTLPNVIGHYFVNWLVGQNELNKDLIITNDLIITANWNDWYIDVTINSNIEEVVAYVDTITVRQGTSNEEVISLVRAENFVTYNPTTHELYDVVITSANTINNLVSAITVEIIVIRTHQYLYLIDDYEIFADTSFLVRLGDCILTAISREINIQPSHQGFDFDGWLYSDEIIDYGFLMTADVVILEASWTIRYFTITFITEFERRTTEVGAPFITHNGTPISSQQIPWNTNVLEFITENGLTSTVTGFTLNGWLLESFNGEGTPLELNGDFTMPHYDIRIYTNWQRNTRFVSFNLNGGTGIAPQQEWLFGYRILNLIDTALFSFSRTGYRFIYWIINGDILEEHHFIQDQNIVLVAQWQEWYVDAYLLVNLLDDAFGIIRVRHGTLVSDFLGIIFEELIAVYMEPRTHEFIDFFIVDGGGMDVIVSNITVFGFFERHSAIIEFSYPEEIGFSIDPIVMPVNVLMLPELVALGIDTLPNIPGYTFSHWQYIAGVNTGIVNDIKLVPFSDPLLTAIFIPNVTEGEYVIIVQSDQNIFNGSNNISFTEVAPSLDIRYFLLNLRNAWNGLDGNTSREFEGITFDIVSQYELLGFYLQAPQVNLLHTDTPLSFNNGVLIVFAIVNQPTQRANLRFDALEDGSFAIGAQITWTSNLGNLVLPSFHNGRKVTVISASLSSRQITRVSLPLYIRRIIGTNAFASNPWQEIDLRGLPHLEYIGNNAFANAAWMAGSRYILIDAITPLLDMHVNAFAHSVGITVRMFGDWNPSVTPQWWNIRARFNSGNRFINQAGGNMNNFF